VLGPGNYLLTEKLTTGQQGLYYPAAPQQINDRGGEDTLLTGKNAIVNRRKYDNCTLTINKLVTDGVTGTSAVPVTQKDSNAVLRFKIYRSTIRNALPPARNVCPGRHHSGQQGQCGCTPPPRQGRKRNPYY
jgi:hypothetical protein